MRTSDDTAPDLRTDDVEDSRGRSEFAAPASSRPIPRSHTTDDLSTTNGEHPAVSLRQVSKVFGGHRAVDAVDLEIRQNEFFAMLGPSGCGKTTTLKMIGGFEQPTSGVVEIAGRDATGEPPFRRDVNTVFQSYALFPHLNVRDNVAFGLRMKKVGRRERARTADEMLERVGLRGYGSRPVPGLSGGEQQRIAVARALVNRPSVLLLDEPLGALDLKLRKSMQTELKQIQHEAGIAFVYVTHDQSEALTMADRIAVMSGGRVAQIGDPVAIYERPATRFVADFIGESSFLDGDVREVEGAQLVVTTGDGATLRAVGEGATRGDRVALAIRPEKVELRRGSGDGASSDAVNRLPGVVTGCTYGGSDTVYDLHTPAGAISARVAMDPARGHDAGTFEIGDRVLATFAVTSTVAVPSETPAADTAATTNDNEA